MVEQYTTPRIINKMVDLAKDLLFIMCYITSKLNLA